MRNAVKSALQKGWRLSWRTLAEMGYRFLIFRPDRLAPGQITPLTDLIEGCLGEGRRVAGAVVYRLP